MQIAICALCAALMVLVVLLNRVSARVANIMRMLSKAAERIAINERDIDALQNHMDETETMLVCKVRNMSEQFDAARQLIDITREAAEEEAKAAKAAQETERRMQEGINSILNYCSQRDDT